MKDFIKAIVFFFLVMGDAHASAGGVASRDYSPSEAEQMIMQFLNAPNPLLKGIAQEAAKKKFKNAEGIFDPEAYRDALARVQRVKDAGNNWNILLPVAADDGRTDAVAAGALPDEGVALAGAAARIMDPEQALRDEISTISAADWPRYLQSRDSTVIDTLITIYRSNLQDKLKQINDNRTRDGESLLIETRVFEDMLSVLDEESSAERKTKKRRAFLKSTLSMAHDIIQGNKAEAFLRRSLVLQPGQTVHEKKTALREMMKTTIPSFSPEIFAEVMEDSAEGEVEQLLRVAIKPLKSKLERIASRGAPLRELAKNQKDYVDEFVAYVSTALWMKAQEMTDDGLLSDDKLLDIGTRLHQELFSDTGELFLQIVGYARDELGDLPPVLQPTAVAESRDLLAHGAATDLASPPHGGAGAPRPALRRVDRGQAAAASGVAGFIRRDLRRVKADQDPIAIAARTLTQKLGDLVSLERQASGAFYQPLTRMVIVDRAIKEGLSEQDSLDKRLALLAAADKEMPIGAILPRGTAPAIGEAFVMAYKQYLDDFVNERLGDAAAGYVGYIRAKLAETFGIEGDELTPRDREADPIAHMVNVITAKLAREGRSAAAAAAAAAAAGGGAGRG